MVDRKKKILNIILNNLKVKKGDNIYLGLDIFKLFKDMCEYQKLRDREQITTLSSSSEFPDFKFLKPIVMKKNDNIYNYNSEHNGSFLK